LGKSGCIMKTKEARRNNRCCCPAMLRMPSRRRSCCTVVLLAADACSTLAPCSARAKELPAPPPLLAFSIWSHMRRNGLPPPPVACAGTACRNTPIGIHRWRGNNGRRQASGGRSACFAREIYSGSDEKSESNRMRAGKLFF